MKAIAIVTAAFLSSACFAQHEQFPDVPENHWVYETLAKLSQERVIPQRLIFHSGPPEDRIELAAWTLHGCSAMLRLLERAELAHEQPGADGVRVGEQIAFLAKLAKETDNLAKMAFLFEPELQKRHIDAMALRRDMLSFPKRLERIADPQGESLPQRITGPDNPLVINSSGAVLQFNTSKRAFDELHVVPVDRYMRLIEVESSEDRYALVLRDKVYNNWKIEIRDRKTGTVAGVVEGDKQVALVCADGEFIIETDAPVTMTGDVKGVTLANVTTNWEIPPGTKKAIELLNAHFKAPFSLHSLDGYLPTRLSPRFGSSQGRILDGGQYAVIARDIKDKASNPRDSAYSLVDMITEHVYANYGSEFQWSSVFVVGRFVFLAPSERGPGTLRVYELNGKLLLAIEYVIVG